MSDLLARLVSLADCDGRAGEPLGKAMREAAAEIVRLRRVIEHDRSAVAEAVAVGKDALRGREWLRLGRGSYEWDDDRWKGEFGGAWDEVWSALENLGKLTHDWSDCPTDMATIREARTAPIRERDAAIARLTEQYKDAFEHAKIWRERAERAEALLNGEQNKPETFRESATPAQKTATPGD